jgi:hypothetical protein
MGKSIELIKAAPVIGHGTGSARILLTRDVEQQANIPAIGNPHNQTLLFMIQWGLLGAVFLYDVGHALADVSWRRHHCMDRFRRRRAKHPQFAVQLASQRFLSRLALRACCRHRRGRSNQRPTSSQLVKS